MTQCHVAHSSSRRPPEATTSPPSSLFLHLRRMRRSEERSASPFQKTRFLWPAVKKKKKYLSTFKSLEIECKNCTDCFCSETRGVRPPGARKRLRGAQTLSQFTNCSPSLAKHVSSGPNTLPHHGLHSGSAPATLLGALLQRVEDHGRPSPSLPERPGIPSPERGAAQIDLRGRRELTQSSRSPLRSLFGKGSLVGAPQPVSNAPDSLGPQRGRREQRNSERS